MRRTEQVESNYTKHSQRLQDVLQFIQITGLRLDYQSEGKVTDKDLGIPKSASSWVSVAEDHPEFFRVEGKNNSISLLARHYRENKQEPLSFEDIKKILDIALILHERQVRNQEREAAKGELRAKYWALIGTIIGVIFTGLFGIIAHLLKP